MNAMRTRRADQPNVARYYLDGRRVSRSAWDAAHLWRDTDSYALRAHTRADGVQIVREYHCIRA